MKKNILLGLTFVAALTACTDDYKDWVEIPSVAQPEIVNFGDGSVSAVNTIDLNKVTTETVQVCNIVAPAVTAEGYTPSFKLTLNGDTDFDIQGDGMLATADLQKYIVDKYTSNPVEREIDAVVSMWLSDGVTAIKSASSGTFKLKATPKAHAIEPAYYVTGTPNGWNNSDTSFKLTNDGSDPYTNPVYTCRIPASEDGSEVKFKMTPESGLGGDWSGCLSASDIEGKFAYDNAGGDLVIPAVEGAKFYDLTFNMLEQTWSYKAISFEKEVFFIGATDGWNNDETYRQRVVAVSDGVYTGYIYMADPNGWGNEFKFQKTMGDWGSEINTGHMTGGISGDLADGGGNFKATAGEGVYFVELDLNANTLKGTRIQNMNLVGDFNGWNQADDAQQMTWNATDYCWEITGAGVTANGWKFTANNAWDINLGGDALHDLTANGPNITAVGSTIKLYPTRRSSDKIFCTVE